MLFLSSIFTILLTLWTFDPSLNREKCYWYITQATKHSKNLDTPPLIINLRNCVKHCS